MSFIFETQLEDISICDDIIEFHKNSRYKFPGNTMDGVNHKLKKSTDVCVDIRDANETLMRYIDMLVKCAGEYIEEYPYCNNGAEWGLAEPLNIQHYAPGEGFYAWHTERSFPDIPAGTRHLAWMTYLNDVDEGGGTEFYHQKYKTTARKGKTVIWPVDWTHTHRGEVAPNEHKYIITGWFTHAFKGSIPGLERLKKKKKKGFSPL